MDIQLGDKLIMKKQHPCGENCFEVIRIGMDFKIRCLGCNHEIMLPRTRCEKNIRRVIRQEKGN